MNDLTATSPKGITVTDQPTVEVTTTIRIGAETQTFTASATTTGAPDKTARGLINAVAGDAANWTHDVQENRR